jgi:tetratricopeptide (TPR) repeat protein
MIGLIDRALALTPSFSRGWFFSGVLRLWAGEPDLAIEHAETALRLSPREPPGTLLSLIGEAYFFKRQFDRAAAQLLLSIQGNPGFPHTYRLLAACYAQMGRLADAHAIVTRLRAITTQMTPRSAPLRRAADRELFLSGLRLAAGNSQ